MKKVLVTGAKGFLGQHLVRYLMEKGCEVVATGRGPNTVDKAHFVTYQDAELTDEIAVKSLLDSTHADVIVHTAAMSKPDECNNNKEQCMLVNVEATKHLLQNPKTFFINISTDFIFGEGGPHAETAIPEPLNFYGQSKLLAEEQVRSKAEKWAVVRPVFIYGKTFDSLRPTFLHWVKNNLEQSKRIKVVSDQLRTPTYVDDICAGIHEIIRRGATGDFHFAGKDIISPYQMAIATAKVLGLDGSLIEEVTSETFPEPVKRAKKSGLKIEKAQKELGYEPVSFEEGVRLTFL